MKIFTSYLVLIKVAKLSLTTIVNKLSKADFTILEDFTEINNFPEELRPDLITKEGDLIVLLNNDKDKDLQESLFEAVGKTHALRQFIKKYGFTSQYSVILVLTLQQYRNLHETIRQVLHQEVPVLIIEDQ